MAWKVELDNSARKDLKRLDRSVAKRILNFLHKRSRQSKNVERILCKIEDSRLVVLVVEIGHRREIYR